MVGEVVSRDLLEQTLALSFGHEDIERGAEGGVDEVAGKEGGADLEGDGHRGGVGFAEEVVGQIVEEVVAEGVVDGLEPVVAGFLAVDLGDESAEVGGREDGEEFAVAAVAGGDGEAGEVGGSRARRALVKQAVGDEFQEMAVPGEFGVDGVASVAAEEFVAPVAREGDLDVLAGGAADPVGGEER